jgi:hypothetical protein
MQELMKMFYHGITLFDFCHKSEVFSLKNCADPTQDTVKRKVTLLCL